MECADSVGAAAGWKGPGAGDRNSEVVLRYSFFGHREKTEIGIRKSGVDGLSVSGKRFVVRGKKWYSP